MVLAAGSDTMKKDKARKLAFAIIGGALEELLAEHGIMLPSADREGREEEACIYGSEYYLLEDVITDILVKGSARHGRQQQEYDIARQILDELEEVLDYHHVKVPSNVPARATSQVALCMPEWDKLRDGIVKLLRPEAATAGQR